MLWNQANRDQLEALLRESRETGRPIEHFLRDREPQWQALLDDALINFTSKMNQYRVQPAPPPEEWRPLTKDDPEAQLLIGKIVRLLDNGQASYCYSLITRLDLADTDAEVDVHGPGWMSFKELFERFVYSDGTRIGVKVS